MRKRDSETGRRDVTFCEGFVKEKLINMHETCTELLTSHACLIKSTPAFKCVPY
jgi:hypothetical protein